MKIEKIIYDTTREIHSVEDKLSIVTVFLFCYKRSSKLFAELLYVGDKEAFILKLNSEYSFYEVDFSVRMDNVNVRSSFFKTLEKVKEKYDSNGYLKALFNKDEFALVIADIVNYNFDKVEMKQLTKKISEQLCLFN
ncbi:hypothetical protein G1K37_11325 [Tenacibaculum dicentrarchi]|nr:hypothetical protein [Tenacibaculum dicentrarchi]